MANKEYSDQSCVAGVMDQDYVLVELKTITVGVPLPQFFSLSKMERQREMAAEVPLIL